MLVEQKSKKAEPKLMSLPLNHLSYTMLRTILGTKNLSEILSDRENIAEDILSNLGNELFLI